MTYESTSMLILAPSVGSLSDCERSADAAPPSALTGTPSGGANCPFAPGAVFGDCPAGDRESGEGDFFFPSFNCRSARADGLK